jgi:hypothetical protein
MMALGLLAKPMLVTLPFALLLLDYWPLERMRLASSARTMRVLLEKLPLLGLAAVFSVITVIAQGRSGAVVSWEALPWSTRMGNALVSYVQYLVHTVWPFGLAVLYPHPGTTLPLWQVLGAGVLLAGLTALFLLAGRRRPYLAVGWLWFIGTMFPVSGVVQVGAQALADRYTYVPNIGLYLMLAWGLRDLLARWQVSPAVGGAVAGLLLTGCTVLTIRQVGYWRETETLWRRTLAVTTGNVVAHINLGEYLGGKENFADAAWHFERALKLKPNLADAHFNLAEALVKLSRVDEAMEHYSAALRADPDVRNAPRAHFRLGEYALQRGRPDEAREHFARAVALDPQYAEPVEQSLRRHDQGELP